MHMSRPTKNSVLYCAAFVSLKNWGVFVYEHLKSLLR